MIKEKIISILNNPKTPLIVLVMKEKIISILNNPKTPLIVLVMLVLVFVGVFFSSQRNNTLGAKSSSGDSKKLIKEVEKFTFLPDEEPTIATVTDPEKLQGQTFFQHAEKGDKVLIFKDAKKAILYRPSVKKIVEIAPITTNSNSSSGSDSGGSN